MGFGFKIREVEKHFDADKRMSARLTDNELDRILNGRKAFDPDKRMTKRSIDIDRRAVKSEE